MENLTPEILTLWPTLQSCFHPVEEYLKLAGRTPSVRLQAVDAFLLERIAALSPAAPSVLDLAADATAGASLVFWLASPSVKQVLTLRGDGETESDWRKQFPALAQELGLDAAACDLNGSAWPNAPLLATLALTEDDAPRLGARLKELFAQQPDATVLLWRLGAVGESDLLKAAWDFCGDGAHRLTLLRELSPFLAGSGLGLIARADRRDLAPVCDRIRQLYEGNFQYLALAKQVTIKAMAQTQSPEKTQLIEQVNTPPTFAKLRYEIKRWLWHHILSSKSKAMLNRLRGRSDDATK